MARHDQDDMTRHTAAFPTIYPNGTNPSGTSQNGTNRQGINPKACSNGSNFKGVASSGIDALASLNDAAISQNSMNGFAVGRPSMNDRLMRASEASWHSSWGSSGAETRESSRTRDLSSLSSRTSIESKTGSKALLPNTGVWNDSPASSQPPLRSVRTSPVHRDSSFNVQDPGSNSSTSQNVVGSRTAYQRSANGSSQHQDQRHMNGSTNAFGHQTRLSDENSQFRGLANAWSNPPLALHSPTNGNNRRSSSFAPSRNGSRDFSQPPSRNGSDYHGTFGQTSTLLRSRSDFPTLSALSNGIGKSPPERNDLQQSDLTGTFARMSIPDSREGSNHSRSHSSAFSSAGLFSQFPQNLTNGHDGSASNNGVAPFQPETLNVFQNPFQQQQPSDSRFAQSGGYLPVLNDLHQNSYSRTGPTYQNPQDPATIAALTLQLQQQQLQLQHQQQMMMLPQQTRYRNPHAPHQPSRMNSQQQYQYPMMPMQPGTLPPAVMQPQTMLASSYPYDSNQTMEVTRITSAKLAEFKELHDKNKQPAIRWELKDIFGYVVEFSGDQVGSRFIQSRLETANSDEKDKLVQEILPEVVQLSDDVFGNYVIQKLFHHCDQAQKRALANKMKTRMFFLSVGQYACRVVQDVLTRILSDQQHELVEELVPDLERLAKNVNANHVIQVSIQTLDPRWHQTVLTAFHGKIFALSKDQYGCRVIQRLLENCVEPEKSRIFEELHPNTVALVTNSYGNYVAQNMMRYGSPEDRSKMIGLIKTYLLLFAKNKFASNVVEKSLTFGSVKERRDLMEVLLQNPDHMCQLIQDSFGNYVIQQFIMLLEGDDYRMFVETMRPQMAKAKANSSGKQIAAVEKLMQQKSANNCTIEMPIHKSATISTNDTNNIDTQPGHDPLPNFGIVG